MAIKRHKRGNKVYLSEYKSVREGKKVRSVFVRYLGPEDKEGVLEKSSRRVLDRLDLSRSSRAGDVRLLWHVAMDLDFANTIDRICCGKSNIQGLSPGKLLTIWAINRAIDPESATQLERWVATTDLPLLAGVEVADLTKEAFLTALDFVVLDDALSGRIVDYTSEIDDSLYQKYRALHPLPMGEKETIAYDLTSVLFFGVSCSLAELGYNPERIKRRQVNLALLVSKHDKYPLAHFVYNGSRNGISTVKNLLVRLQEASIEPGLIVWDRGNMSKEHVQMVEESGWKLLSGVPKTLKEVRAILDTTEVPANPETLARGSKAGKIYAVKGKASLYGVVREVVVYTNRERGVKDADARNEALAVIGRELERLNVEGGDWSEKKLHKEIGAILGEWREFVEVRVSRKREEGRRILWRYRGGDLKRAERMDGKWVLLCTDESRSAEEAVNTYLEKDFIEKVFRTIKTDEEVEPVRHRLESRVRAYLFVCTLAYRLLAALQYKLKLSLGKDDSWERADDLLKMLSRVERTEVKFGKEIKTLYLNLTNNLQETLQALGLTELFKEETKIAM